MWVCVCVVCVCGCVCVRTCLLVYVSACAFFVSVTEHVRQNAIFRMKRKEEEKEEDESTIHTHTHTSQQLHIVRRGLKEISKRRDRRPSQLCMLRHVTQQPEIDGGRVCTITCEHQKGKEHRGPSRRVRNTQTGGFLFLCAVQQVPGINTCMQDELREWDSPLPLSLVMYIFGAMNMLCFWVAVFMLHV